MLIALVMAVWYTFNHFQTALCHRQI